MIAQCRLVFSGSGSTWGGCQKRVFPVPEVSDEGSGGKKPLCGRGRPPYRNQVTLFLHEGLHFYGTLGLGAAAAAAGVVSIITLLSFRSQAFATRWTSAADTAASFSVDVLIRFGSLYTDASLASVRARLSALSRRLTAERRAEVRTRVSSCSGCRAGAVRGTFSRIR